MSCYASTLTLCRVRCFFETERSMRNVNSEREKKAIIERQPQLYGDDTMFSTEILDYRFFRFGIVAP